MLCENMHLEVEDYSVFRKSATNEGLE